MRDVTLSLCLASGMIWLGAILHIVGVFTHHWQDYTHVADKFRTHKGLFRLCDAVKCYEAEDSRSRRACQAFMIVGSVTGFLGGVVSVVFILLKTFTSWQPPKVFTYVTTYVCVSSFFCSLIGIIIYAATLRFPVLEWGFSFGLCLAGAFLTLFGGVLVTIGNVSWRRTQSWSPDDH